MAIIASAPWSQIGGAHDSRNWKKNACFVSFLSFPYNLPHEYQNIDLCSTKTRFFACRKGNNKNKNRAECSKTAHGICIVSYRVLQKDSFLVAPRRNPSVLALGPDCLWGQGEESISTDLLRVAKSSPQCTAMSARRGTWEATSEIAKLCFARISIFLMLFLTFFLFIPLHPFSPSVRVRFILFWV